MMIANIISVYKPASISSQYFGCCCFFFDLVANLLSSVKKKQPRENRNRDNTLHKMITKEPKLHLLSFILYISGIKQPCDC